VLLESARPSLRHRRSQHAAFRFAGYGMVMTGAFEQYQTSCALGQRDVDDRRRTLRSTRVMLERSAPAGRRWRRWPERWRNARGRRRHASGSGAERLYAACERRGARGHRRSATVVRRSVAVARGAPTGACSARTWRRRCHALVGVRIHRGS
jgi:hypothetical protein